MGAHRRPRPPVILRQPAAGRRCLAAQGEARALVEHAALFSPGLPPLAWLVKLLCVIALVTFIDGRAPTDLMHRDVKPGNILLKADHKTIKLIDYGICRSISTAAGDPRPLSGQTGSFRYMAPEIAVERTAYDYSSMVDVYSGAMVVWFIHTGERPYSNLPGHQVAELAHRVSLRPSAASVKNEHLASLLTRAWDDNPSARPHAYEINSRLQELYEKAAGKGILRGMADKLKEGMSSFNSSFARLKSHESSTESTPRDTSSPASDASRSPETPSTTLTYSQLKRHLARGARASCPGTPEDEEPLPSFGRQASEESCATTLRPSSCRVSGDGDLSGELSVASGVASAYSWSPSSRDCVSPPDARKRTCEKEGGAEPGAPSLPMITKGLGPYIRPVSSTAAQKSRGAASPSEHDGAAVSAGLTIQKPVCVWKA